MNNVTMGNYEYFPLVHGTQDGEEGEGMKQEVQVGHGYSQGI